MVIRRQNWTSPSKFRKRVSNVANELLDKDIDPRRIRKVNASFDEQHVVRLTASMKQLGWSGRPLLVVEVQQYGFVDFFAWSGSHRVEAAMRANLDTVPCRVISRADADKAFGGAGYDRYGFSCWRDAVTSAEGMYDNDRLRGLEKAGLAEAAQMLREEITAKKRISVEEFAQCQTGLAQDREAAITSLLEEFAGEFSLLGISLVSASAVFWSSAHSRLLEQLPAERYSTFMDTYYEQAWEGIVSRFGAQKAQYDELQWELDPNGWTIPDEIKTDWALRSGVHDVLRVAVELICPAADEWHAASDSDKSAAAMALGKAVGRVLFGGQTELDVVRVKFSYSRFIAIVLGFTEVFHELETDGFQVY